MFMHGFGGGRGESGVLEGCCTWQEQYFVARGLAITAWLSVKMSPPRLWFLAAHSRQAVT
jgi:hypothetical protein